MTTTTKIILAILFLILICDYAKPSSVCADSRDMTFDAIAKSEERQARALEKIASELETIRRTK
jgi:hypothetical protein